MNDDQHAYWLAYIRRLADLMRLRDWDIELDRSTANDPTSGAAVAAYYGKKRTRVYLGPAFLAYTPEEQREILSHEMIHCHVEPIAEWARLYMSEKESTFDGSFAATTFRREEELLVDTLAVMIAPFLPLPLPL